MYKCLKKLIALSTPWIEIYPEDSTSTLWPNETWGLGLSKKLDPPINLYPLDNSINLQQQQQQFIVPIKHDHLILDSDFSFG